MRLAGFLFLGLWAAASQAQTMYKCMDSQKRVTYSNITCEKQGLQDSGPVADRTTSMPFTPPPKPVPRAEPAKNPVPASDDAEVGRGGAQVKPISPPIEKLVR